MKKGIILGAVIAVVGVGGILYMNSIRRKYVSSGDGKTYTMKKQSGTWYAYRNGEKVGKAYVKSGKAMWLSYAKGAEAVEITNKTDASFVKKLYS